MGTLIIDLPLTMICRSQIQINPLTEAMDDVPAQSPRFCLSLMILLLPYGYLLYQYAVSISVVHHKNLYHELDRLDMSVIIISILRLCMLFVFPIINHGSGMVVLAVLAFSWQLVVLFIFIKFIVDDERIWRYVCYCICGVYLLLWIIVNYIGNNGKEETGIVIPLVIPMLIMTIAITAIGGHQLFLIHNSLNQNILTPTIIIELKNRRSFIFMILVCSWLSLIMRWYPDIFKPLQGVVLYFLVCQWLSMAIIFRCVLDRIVRSNDEEEELEEGWGTRNSGLIVVEMQNYGNK